MSTTYRPGQSVKNGSIIVERRGQFVLCVLPHNEFHPYAVWRLDDATGETFGGDYCQTLEEAIEGLRERAGTRPLTNRPGDMAAIYAEETGIPYSEALVACNMD